MQQQYFKRKRDKIDRCNICGTETSLTWDHVPPQCCYNSEKTIYNSLFSDVEQFQEEFNKNNISQNGIKFRSICNKCNNGLLGGYDKELDKMVQKIKNVLFNNTNIIDNNIHIKVKINKVVRSLAGHLLAAKNYFEEKCLIDIKLREYVLTHNMLPPQDMQMLWRVYPYTAILLIRDMATKRNSENRPSLPNGVISCMSAFPLAIILGDKIEYNCGLDDLFMLCTDNIEEEIDVPIKLSSMYFEGTNSLRPLMWPCNISEEEDGTDLIIVGKTIDDSVVAIRDKEKMMKKIKKE